MRVWTIRLVLMVLLPFCAMACGGPDRDRPATPAGAEPVADTGNPAAADFDAAGSDARAIEIADRTMAAMGGRRAWDDTRFVVWNFFGFRFHAWDRSTGDIRVEWTSRKEPIGDFVVTMNLGSGEGSAWIDGEPVSDPDRRAELLGYAYEAWVNDSYWLFMPYKLKDSGVTLTYIGEGQMEDGRDADILQLVFDQVGVTPQNKYHVYVARDSGLVEQWDFFEDAADDEPGFTTPWHGWTPHGAILLSGDRGQRQISEIAVYEALPRSVFDSPEPTGLRTAS